MAVRMAVIALWLISGPMSAFAQEEDTEIEVEEVETVETVEQPEPKLSIPDYIATHSRYGWKAVCVSRIETGSWTAFYNPQGWHGEHAQGYFGWMLLAHVLVAGAFVWIYERGISAERPWLGQGLRFGLAVALLTVVPTYLIYYAVQPMSGTLVAKQVLFDAIGVVVLGVIAGWMYRPRGA